MVNNYTKALLSVSIYQSHAIPRKVIPRLRDRVEADNLDDKAGLIPILPSFVHINH
jgi:hypothetical protein